MLTRCTFDQYSVLMGRDFAIMMLNHKSGPHITMDNHYTLGPGNYPLVGLRLGDYNDDMNRWQRDALKRHEMGRQAINVLLSREVNNNKVPEPTTDQVGNARPRRSRQVVELSDEQEKEVRVS